MEFETILDPKGKEHMVFNAQELNDDVFIGDKSSDFEYLQLLGEGGFGKVLKVSSLINHKIYAMKILDLVDDDRLSKEDKEKYFTSEIELLKQLNHPNIVKYYKSFREEDKLYIIMEYFDNGDLDDYIKVLKFDKNLDKKPEIWNIFYQSLSGLNYLHSSGVVHRDIKPPNIFMSKNKIIKIGDFGESELVKEKKNMKKIRHLKYTVVGTPEYMAPELSKQKEYNEKIDIYSMGCVFYKICCLKDYQKEDVYLEGDTFKTKIIQNEIPTNYDTDLMDIIKLMVEPDPNKRKDSKFLLEKILENYNKVFIQNSGLYSVLRCMSNLPYLRNFFLTKYKGTIPTVSGISITGSVFQNIKKPYSENFLSLIEKKNNWIENLTFYRQKIIEENNFLNNNKEINPYLILTFILDKIHGELNKVQVDPKKSLRKKKTSFIDPMKEDKIKRDYTSSFSANFNSNISNNFVAHMETIRTCCNCNRQSYLFTYFFSLSFDLNLPLLLKKEIKEIDVIDLFTMQNDISLDLKGLKKLQCSKCNKEVEHKESKIFYSFPFQLVLNFDRGNDYENKIKINYPEKLDLSKIPKEQKYSSKLYDLVGVIKKCNVGKKEHFISLVLNPDDKSWYLFYNEQMEKIKGPYEHKDGDVLMLFYVAKKN